MADGSATLEILDDFPPLPCTSPAVYCSTNNGNILEEDVTTPGVSGLKQTFTYDALNRLATATVKNSGGTTTRSETFSYDISSACRIGSSALSCKLRPNGRVATSVKPEAGDKPGTKPGTQSLISCDCAAPRALTGRMARAARIVVEERERGTGQPL